MLPSQCDPRQTEKILKEARCSPRLLICCEDVPRKKYARLILSEQSRTAIFNTLKKNMGFLSMIKSSKVKLIKKGRCISASMVYISASILKHEVFSFLLDSGVLGEDNVMNEEDLDLRVFVKPYFQTIAGEILGETGLEVLYIKTYASILKNCILDDISHGGAVALPIFEEQVVILQASIGGRMWTLHLLKDCPPLRERLMTFMSGYP